MTDSAVFGVTLKNELYQSDAFQMVSQGGSKSDRYFSAFCLLIDLWLKKIHSRKKIQTNDVFVTGC